MIDKEKINKIRELGPPLSPPNRDVKMGLFGGIETRESKKRGEDYLKYLDEYRAKRETIIKNKS